MCATPPLRRWFQFGRLLPFAVFLATLPGCVILDARTADAMMHFQARQIAHSRLMVFAVCCLMALPLSVALGLWWRKKTMTLRSMFVLLTVECVLLAAFVAMRNYFD